MTQAAPGMHLLSLRLGACPCVQCLDAHGEASPGFNEYGWVITTLDVRPAAKKHAITIHRYLAYYGIAVIAHELGLLEKYNVHPEQAALFFHGMLSASNALARHEAKNVYRRLGAHVAMLACEIHRHRPLGAVMLLGAEAVGIDRLAFSSLYEGFYDFMHRHALQGCGLKFLFAQDASAKASLVGVAHAASQRR